MAIVLSEFHKNRKNVGWGNLEDYSCVFSDGNFDEKFIAEFSEFKRVERYALMGVN